MDLKDKRINRDIVPRYELEGETFHDRLSSLTTLCTEYKRLDGEQERSNCTRIVTACLWQFKILIESKWKGNTNIFYGQINGMIGQPV